MNPTQLWTKHRPLARKIAGRYHLPGASRDDVQQEALIGLWEAARTYDPGRGCTFRSWANRVVETHLFDCVKAATRLKQQPLSDACELPDLPHWHQVTDRCEEREDIRRLLEALGQLSERERYYVLGVASGLAYSQLGRNFKEVDNTLYAARRKLRTVLD